MWAMQQSSTSERESLRRGSIVSSWRWKTPIAVLLVSWTVLLAVWSFNLTRLPASSRTHGCAVCLEMVSEIRRRSPDLNAMANSADTEQLLMQATTMLTLWNVPVGDYVNEATAIVGFSFAQGPLVDGTPTPGGTNRALAWSVARLLANYAAAGKPRPQVMVQWEIAQVLWEEHGVRADVSATVDAEGNYLSTYGVMQQIAVALRAAGIHTVALVAHPDHAVRCGKVVQHFNVTALGSEMLHAEGGVPWARFGCDDDGYDATSSQPWTTSRTRYLLHELKARPAMVIASEVDFSNDNFQAHGVV